MSQFYGFEICENLMVENGFDKVVLYGTANRGFEHVALQLPNGNWTSKMGDYEDIEHYSLDAVAGDFYGHPLIYMKRERIKLEK